MKKVFILGVAVLSIGLNGTAIGQVYDSSFDYTDFDPYAFEEIDPNYGDFTTPTQDSLVINPKIIEQLKEIEKEGNRKKPNADDLTKEEIADQLAAANDADKRESGPGFGARVQGMFSEYWVQFLALVVSLIGVVLAVSGFSLATKKKQKYLKKYLHEIDDVYSSYKWKTKRCEAELYRLQDQIEDQLKEGAIDENTYHLLEKRIEKYLDEIKYSEERPMHADKPHHKEHSREEKQDNAKKLADQIDEIGKDL